MRCMIPDLTQVAWIATIAILLAAPAMAWEPIPDKLPDKLVVLTFDDSVKSHFTVVRPILKKYGFGATFYITEGFDFKTNKEHYMTWEQIAQLHKDGFEIGNHTRDHLSVTDKTVDQLAEQIKAVNEQCRAHGIPATTTFCYPANHFTLKALPILRELGIKFARRGNQPEYPSPDYHHGKGFGYEPGLDHPLLIPSTGIARPGWTLDDFILAARKARYGRIAVLQFHGVPDVGHPWVNTPIKDFEIYMRYLHDYGYKVIALRDLENYVDPRLEPKDPLFVIADRQKSLADGVSRNEFRPPLDEAGLRGWMEIMVWHHRFTKPEIQAATGLSLEKIEAALTKFNITLSNRPERAADAPLKILPYPGGRHPRRGFLDGAVRPQRETKVSIFTPWDQDSYVVLDAPEAIRRHDEQEHGLLYLAHTHVPTMWTRQGIQLEKLEWKIGEDGALTSERRLPNGVVFGTTIKPQRASAHIEMWLTNGSEETLRNLRVQNCLMLYGASEFASQPASKHVYAKPYAACQSTVGDRWVIVAWQPCNRTWSNADCPCLHSDPQFPDCDPGETKMLRGWFSFYKGGDIQAEFQRIEATGWRTK